MLSFSLVFKASKPFYISRFYSTFAQQVHIFMKYLLIITASIFLWSCAGQEEKALEDLDKKSAREVTLMTVQHGDSVYHISKQKIWFNGEMISESIDTLTTPNKVATWGEEAGKTSLAEVPIYVTVQ